MDRRRLPRLSLDLLRGFCAAARHLSFTRAAQELSVTQPAISNEVRTIEAQLGTPLFHRVNRALRLTQAGEELYRAVDEALALIDTAAQRLTGRSCTLAVTSSVPFASTWLGARLPRFARLHPDFNLRVAASNDVLDLDREHIDIAIRYARTGATPPSSDKLCDYRTFPVCAPALMRARPIRSPADLSQHVLLELEMVRNGRPWYDWQQWFDAMKLRGTRAAGSLRFSHYDQVLEAAVQGCGVAIGIWPHVAGKLRDRSLVAPLGDEAVARLGALYILISAAAQRVAAESFVAWLRAEVRRDSEKPRRRAASADR